MFGLWFINVYITPKDEESVYMCSVYTCFIVCESYYIYCTCSQFIVWFCWICDIP